MILIKCADCGCTPEECKQSPSPKDCPNCNWDECCCWEAIKTAEFENRLHNAFESDKSHSKNLSSA